MPYSRGKRPALLMHKAPGPALRTPYGPGADPPTTPTKEQVLMPERIGPQAPKHDPRTCQPCGFLRHPAQAAQGRALAKHLAAHPLPRQAAAQ